jgi:hypothetical protein
VNRKIAVHKDIFEDSWVVQEWRREGELRGLHLAIQDIIQARFPEILPYAKKQLKGIEDTEVLRCLNVKMSTAQTAEEALQYLFTVGKEDRRTDAGYDESSVSG